MLKRIGAKIKKFNLNDLLFMMVGIWIALKVVELTLLLFGN